MNTKPFYNHDPITHDVADAFYDKDDYVDQLYTALTTFIEPPYSVSLNGRWGPGKTTLMRQLVTRFEGEGFPVLWFNPWEYERAGDITFLFLVELTKLAKASLGVEILKECGIFGVGLLYSGIDAAAGIMTGGAVSYDNVKKHLDNAEQELGGRLAQYRAENPVEVFKKDFVTLTQKLFKKYQNKPLVVFFDDLDRCLPDNALGLIESLKNLFMVKGAKTLFISGLDTGVVKQFIIERYTGLDAEFAYNYFKKIFNLTINVPRAHKDTFQALFRKRLQEVSNTPEIHQLMQQEGQSISPEIITCLSDVLIQMEVVSIRQGYNILTNVLLFWYMNPHVERDHRVYVPLFAFKECFPDLFEMCQAQAAKSPEIGLYEIFNPKRYGFEERSREYKILQYLMKILQTLETAATASNVILSL